jgi:hypothetical protein
VHVLKNSIIIGAISVLITISLIQSSDAELWDLVILADVENPVIVPGQAPSISGVIVNHASHPVPQVYVHIRSGQESIFTTTDDNGQFRALLNDSNRIPGTYIVSIVGNAQDGKTGIGTTQFQVKGDLTRTSILEEKLSTPEAKRYLDSSVDDFNKDPIGYTLFNYYQKLYQEYVEEVKITQQLTDEQIFIQQQKIIAEELRMQAIDEFDPKIGTFSGYKYEDYIRNLNPEVRDTISNQINFTKNLFNEAQFVREQVLLNGGTEEEARQAYIAKITTTRDALINFGSEQPQIEEIINATSIQSIENQDNIETTLEDKNESLVINVDGSDIKIDFDGKIFIVNVNGTNIEFMVNATGIYQIN